MATPPRSAAVTIWAPIVSWPSLAGHSTWTTSSAPTRSTGSANFRGKLRRNLNKVPARTRPRNHLQADRRWGLRRSARLQECAAPRDELQFLVAGGEVTAFVGIAFEGFVVVDAHAAGELDDVADGRAVKTS